MGKDEETIFAEALRQPSPQGRAAFLDSACAGDAALRAGVNALLAAHQCGTGILDVPPPGVVGASATPANDDDPESAAEQIGTMIGPYKLLQQLGEGGMGAVFMAEQTHPVQRKVALKIIKPGLDTKQVIARFEAERQALAMMDHPGIAKVLDAGATDAGRSYFVMELVRGIPITEYCDQNQLNPRQRLDLFVQVCQAVQHAHTKGIIHRDLKPSNVLVTIQEDRPVPKIIDFGIAKATAGQRLTDRTLFTEFRQLIGTPLYMSPEQAEMSAVMDVDTRSDVYSLGVLLYELLTGTTPFDKHRLAAAAYDEVRRIFREEEPPKPSTRLSTMLGSTLTAVSTQRHTDAKKLGLLVRGELDWIVMRALEKDRTRRYETADGLAKDVGRYLSDQPVEACPPSRRYRFRKFARRNKAALATIAIIAAVLMLATVVSTWQAVRATRAERQVARERDQVQAEKRRADEQAAIALAVNDFLAEMLSAADPDRLLGDKVTVLQATQQALKRLDEGALADQPLIESAVRNTIGSTLQALSRYEEAEPALRKALEIRRQALPVGHTDIVGSLNNLAVLLMDQGKLAEAEPLLREALVIQRRALPARHSDDAPVLNNLASVLRGLGRLDEAELLYREALEMVRKALPAGHRNIATVTGHVAGLLRDQGKLDEAEPLFRESLDIYRSALPAGHRDIALCMNSLAGLLRAQGKLDEAETLSREALDILRRSLPVGHPHIASGMITLAGLLRDQGKLDEAEPLLREALEIRRKALPAGHPEIAYGMRQLSELLWDHGKLGEAETLSREALDILRRSLPVGHPHIANGMITLAGLLRDQGKLGEAEPLYREALEMKRKAWPAGHPEIANSMGHLAVLLQAQGKLTEAEPLFREDLEICRKSRPAGHTDIANGMNNLASLLHARGKLREAEPLFREALDRYRKVLPAGHWDIARVVNDLAGLLRDQGKLDEAEPLYREALEIRRNKFGARAQATTQTATRLASVLSALHREDEADVVRRQYELSFHTTAPTTPATGPASP